MEVVEGEDITVLQVGVGRVAFMKGTAGLWTGERWSGQGRDCPGTFSAVMPGCIVSRQAWAQGGVDEPPQRPRLGQGQPAQGPGDNTARYSTSHSKHTQSVGMRIFGYNPCSNHPVTSIW